MLDFAIGKLNRVINVRVALPLLAIAAVGCAPDSVTNRQATGFNGYLDTLANDCRPLVIGPYNVGGWLTMRGSDDPNYNYFFNMTSRLYYGTVSQAEYQEGVGSFLGPGSTNGQAFACIFANLTSQRPPAGAGM
jgi:hypothetical protein